MPLGRGGVSALLPSGVLRGVGPAELQHVAVHARPVLDQDDVAEVVGELERQLEERAVVLDPFEGQTGVAVSILGWDFERIPAEVCLEMARAVTGLKDEEAAGVEKLAAKWRRPGVEVVAEALLPSAGPDEAAEAARRLASRRPGLVAMDCMSYTPATKAAVKAELGVPTVLAVTATARVLQELMT